jgi:hypothetical protein
MDGRDLATALTALEHLTVCLERLADGRERDRLVYLHTHISALRGMVERLARVEQEELLDRYERKKANEKVLADQRRDRLRESADASHRRHTDHLQSHARAIRLA